jgi:hypothetical protein
MPMQSWFTSTGHSAIHGLASLVDTNLDEGLRLAKRQLETTQSREGVPRYVVLVTDGRPTAFRGTYPVPLIAPLGLDGVIAAEDDGQSYRGLFRPTDGRRIESINALGQLVTSSNDSTAPSPLPELLSDGSTDPAAVIRSLAEAKALERAAAIRASGAKIIVVAIQPPNPSHPLDTPDLAYLDRIANVGGISDPNGSRGEVFVADPDTLADTLATVAGRMLVTRLAPRLI